MSAIATTPPSISQQPVELRPRAAFLLAVFSLLFIAGLAVAQAQSDPPSRVGRLSDAGGSVFLAPDNSETGWQQIGINYPVTMGDNLWVSAESRAEIDFGAGQLRLANEANIHFSQLDDRQFSAFLANGRANLRLRTIDAGEGAKLDTPNAQIDIVRTGSYRLDTNSDSTHTTLVVREGEAQVRVGERSITVYSGQTASVQGNGYGAAMMVRDGLGMDGFDAYASDRDRRIEAAGVSDQYVSSYVPGVADLNAYGEWETTPSYGAVWYPTAVATEWVPYQDGTWTYVRPWGWTWVDNAPWGWAPFHYGRWVRTGSRWGWAPGEFVRRPVYSPALVAWYGGPAGTSWAAGFTSGPTFGWVPLSWGEAYWPQYRHSTDYWRRTNQPVAVDVRRMPTRAPERFSYANARIPGAVIAASSEVLSNRRPVGPNHYRVPQQALTNAPLTTAPLDLRPTTRPMSIDKMPPRAPMPASSFVSRSRPGPDASSTSNFGGRPGAPQMIPRQGSLTSQPTRETAPTFQSLPGSAQPLPGAAPTVGGRNTVIDPAAGARAPGAAGGFNDPRNVAGQSYVPNNRPQPSPRQQNFDPVPAPQQIQARPAPAPMSPSQAAPLIQQAPAQQYVPQRRPSPGVVRDMPAPQPLSSPGAPISIPQQPSMHLAPAPAYVPQQRVAPIQRAPVPMQMPMPVAPGPSSITPAPSSITPAPNSIAPASGAIGAAGPHRQVPQQPQQFRPGEMPQAAPGGPSR